MSFAVGVDSPEAEDVQRLLAAHLAFTRGVTPAEYSFAMDVEQLVDPGVTFFSARDGGRVLGIAALKRLGRDHAELKSMHTARADRGRGVGRALLAHVLLFAAAQGYRRLSLETGTTDDFLPARTLYERAGFAPCEPFGDYRSSPYNTFMTLAVDSMESSSSASRRSAGTAQSVPPGS